MGAKPGQRQQGRSGKSAGRQRLALVVFGAILILLFVGFAIAQGIGSPSVPSGNVAVVEGVPDDIGLVSEAEFKRALLQQAAQGGLKKPPKPGEGKYEELKEAVMGELLDQVWIQGEAEELGISVTPKQIATELAQIKKQNFKTEAEYQKFLKTSRFTKKDVLTRVRLQLLGTQIQERISQTTPQIAEGEIEAYYNSVKDTQFTTAESRDIRAIVNASKEKAEQAKAALEKDSSPTNWKKVAAKYSEDPTSKANGGLQPALSEELLAGQDALKSLVFDSAVGVVVGPTEVEGKYFVIEVQKLNPEKVQTLKEVSGQIKSQLGQQIQQEIFAQFVSGYQTKWESRTFCAADFKVKRCSNYKGNGLPANAPPACFEADPKGGLPGDCPAPVTQPAPALPGSTTLIKPQGDRLPQRPRPAGLPAASEGALPETAVPTPSGAAPPPGE